MHRKVSVAPRISRHCPTPTQRLFAVPCGFPAFLPCHLRSSPLPFCVYPRGCVLCSRVRGSGWTEEGYPMATSWASWLINKSAEGSHKLIICHCSAHSLGSLKREHDGINWQWISTQEQSTTNRAATTIIMIIIIIVWTGIVLLTIRWIVTYFITQEQGKGKGQTTVGGDRWWTCTRSEYTTALSCLFGNVSPRLLCLPSCQHCLDFI